MKVLSPQREIVRAFVAYLLFVGAALIVPRVAAKGQEGLAAAGTAAFWFLIISFFALSVSIISFVMTLRRRKKVSRSYRIMGFAPLAFTVIAILSLTLVFMTQKEEPSSPGPVRKTVPASVHHGE
jgi:peptidoglycan/LPS O-acetylase OafA/YrhL